MTSIPLPPTRPAGLGLSQPKPAQAGPAPGSPADAKLRANAREFESVFLETVFDGMLSGLGEEGPLGSNGAGGDIWRTQLANQYAKATAAAGGIGIADSIHRELVRMQADGGQAQAPASPYRPATTAAPTNGAPHASR